MENKELIQLLKKELAIEIAEQLSYSEVHAILSAYINDLIKNDFEKMIGYLYRIDVNEQKLKNLMQQNPLKNTGDVIATLIIERQDQKIKDRKRFHKREDDMDIEERW